MNLRHTAALALVGWYLMVPPISRGSADFKAPMREWTKVEADSDTEAACGKALRDHTYLVKFGLQIEQIRYAQCVYEHNPRLMGWRGGFIGLIR